MPKAKKNTTEKEPEKDVFSDISNKVEDSVGWTSVWSSNQEKWHRIRMRIKKEKTFPFPGCSNLRMPTAETKIRKVKAGLINSVFGIRPVVQAVPSPSGNWETARKIEKFLDHLVMDIIDVKGKAVIEADQTCEKGFYLMQPYWRCEIMTRNEDLDIDDLDEDEVLAFFSPTRSPDDMIEDLAAYLEVDRSDRVWDHNYKALEDAVSDLLQNKTELKVSLKDVIYDFPDVALISPERCYVPTDSGYDPQKCEYVCIEKFIPLRELKYNAKEKGWNSSEVGEISGKKGLDPQKLTDVRKNEREGIERLNQSGLVRVWEFYGWYDLNNDGEQEKVFITLAPDFSKVLRKITLPFESGKYPLIKFFYENTDDRWFSHRGIVEIAEDLIKEIDLQHNQKIDQQTVRNAPMFLYRAGMVNPNMVQFMPTQAIPVHGMNALSDTISVLNANNPNVEFSYEREEQILLGRLEELVGSMDFNLQSTINRREPRTLGEVNLQAQAQQLVFSLDAEMHSKGYSDLFNWIWDLWCQYGKDEYEFAYFGPQGYEPIKLSREEIQGHYKITVRGNDQNTNPQARLQKAQQILMAATNPLLLQTGVMTPMHQANALKRFFQELDIPNWEELANFQPQPPQQPGPPPIQPSFGDLTDFEKAQVMSKSGIRPDIQGRLLQKQQELQENLGGSQ